MRRTLMALLVALTLVVGLPATAAPSDPGGTFLDDDGSVHEPSIEAVATAEVTLGCDAAGTVFCPSRPVTRAQMATFLSRALGLPDPTTDYFTDDTGNTHETNINKIADAGISLGCDSTGTIYCPDDPVTRAQMATFLSRALGLPDPTTDYFTDDTGNTHETNINKIADAGISLGCDSTGTIYCPDDPVTRAQMATFLTRALSLTPTPAAARPETLNGETFAAFEFTVTCNDVLDCPGTTDLAEGAWYLSEGWNLDNWSISDPLDQQAFQSDATRVEYMINGGDPVRTFETFEVDANDTARKRQNFQMPSDLTGTHVVEVLWYQDDELRFRVVVTVTLTPP